MRLEVSLRFNKTAAFFPEALGGLMLAGRGRIEHQNIRAYKELGGSIKHPVIPDFNPITIIVNSKS